MIRVILADDHPIVRQGVRQFLDLQPDIRVVAEAADGAEVVARLAARPCDVLVLDLSLPHLSGMELLLQVRQTHPGVKIVIFTMQPEDALALHLLNAGASGYLCKDRPTSELLDAIRRAAAGGRYVTDQLADLAFERGKPRAPLPHEALSAREYQVFLLLLRGRSVTDIAGELEISGSTASNHLAKIREKLGVSSNGEILLYAHRVGLLG